MDKKQDCSRWICCPVCGGRTRTKVYEDTVLVKFPLYCPKCKKEIRVDGDDVKTVQGNLGHATAAFTLDVYGHVSEKMKEGSAARMEAYISGL